MVILEISSVLLLCSLPAFDDSILSLSVRQRWPGCAETARVRRHIPHARTWKISYSVLLSVPDSGFPFSGVVRFGTVYQLLVSKEGLFDRLELLKGFCREISRQCREVTTCPSIRPNAKCRTAVQQTECRDRERFIPFSIRSWPRGRRLRLSPSRVSPISCTARATEQQRRHRPLHTQRGAVHSSRSFFCRISLVRV